MRRIEQKKLQIICGYLDELLPQFQYEKPEDGLQIVGKFNDVNTPAFVNKCNKAKIEFINMASCEALEFNFNNSTIHQTYDGLYKLAKWI